MFTFFFLAERRLYVLLFSAFFGQICDCRLLSVQARRVLFFLTDVEDVEVSLRSFVAVGCFPLLLWYGLACRDDTAFLYCCGLLSLILAGRSPLWMLLLYLLHYFAVMMDDFLTFAS